MDDDAAAGAAVAADDDGFDGGKKMKKLKGKNAVATNDAVMWKMTRQKVSCYKRNSC